jgi:hypothetical protein
MAQNNLLKAGKRLATAAKEQVVSAAQQKVAGVKKKLGTIGSSPVRLTRAATYEVNRAALRLEGKSSGPNTRGGKRKSAQSAKPPVAPVVDKKPTNADKKPAKKVVKKVVTKTASAAQAAAAPAKTMSAREAAREAKTSATTERVAIVGPQANNALQSAGAEFQASNGKRAKRDVKMGALVGRTDGKWHLGKKVGKG